MWEPCTAAATPVDASCSAASSRGPGLQSGQREASLPRSPTLPLALLPAECYSRSGVSVSCFQTQRQIGCPRACSANWSLEPQVSCPVLDALWLLTCSTQREGGFGASPSHGPAAGCTGGRGLCRRRRRRRTRWHPARPQRQAAGHREAGPWCAASVWSHAAARRLPVLCMRVPRLWAQGTRAPHVPPPNRCLHTPPPPNRCLYSERPPPLSCAELTRLRSMHSENELRVLSRLTSGEAAAGLRAGRQVGGRAWQMCRRADGCSAVVPHPALAAGCR